MATFKKCESLALFKSEIAGHEKLSMYRKILDDDLLIGFLRGKHYNVQEAIECLVKFVHVRTHKYKRFCNKYLNDPISSTMLDLGKIRILKGKDSKGRRVAVDQISLWDTSRYTLYEGMAEIVFIMDEAIRSYLKESDGNEVVIIFNCADICFAQVRQGTPFMIKQSLDLFLNSMPIRPAAMHLINVGPLVHFLLRIVTRFIKEKLRNRILIHSSQQSLHEHFPPTMLPKSLGGSLTNEEAFEQEMITNIRSHADFYRKITAA